MDVIDKWKARKAKKSLSINMDKWYAILEEDADMMLKVIHEVDEKYGRNEQLRKWFLNFVFIRFSSMDIIKLYKMYNDLGDAVEKKLIGRTLAIHLYEFLEDVNTMIGRPMAALFSRLKDKTGIQKELNGVRDSFNLMKEDFQKLQKVRNYVAAHKDKDVFQQIEVMRDFESISLDVIVVVKLGLFLAGLKHFEKHLIAELHKQNAN